MTATIVLPTYRVARVSAPGARNSYQVFALQDDGGWDPASKEYEHSTSAFAALGRLVQREVVSHLELEKKVDPKAPIHDNTPEHMRKK